MELPRVRARSVADPLDSPQQQRHNPNWLCCASCHAPIVHTDELLIEPFPALTQAVYVYPLDMVDKEVSVYSATNSDDNRFDVVRAVLDESRSVPKLLKETSGELDSLRELLNSLRGIRSSEARSHVTSALDGRTAAEVLEDLEDYIEREGLDAEDTSPEEETGGSDTIASRLVMTGEPTDDYSWFPGYSWTIACCSSCGQHIGWIFFEKVEDEWVRGFLSLIVTKLREKYLDSV